MATVQGLLPALESVSAALYAQFASADKRNWDGAIHNSFCGACVKGTLEKKHFLRWLEQDFKFIEGFVRLAGRALSLAPKEHFGTLIDLLTAIKAETAWFKEQARKENVNFEKVKILPITARYLDLMESWQSRSYAAIATALWGIEYSYYKAWKETAEVKAPYNELKERWSNDDFGKAVAALEGIANECLAHADKATQNEAAKLCNQIAVIEIEFWDMAMKA